MSRNTVSGRSDGFGVADMFLAGRTDILSPELDALFRAAVSPATPEELAEGADAIAAFLAFGPGSVVAEAEPVISPASVRSPLRRRLAAALTGAALLMGGMSAAAYAGQLPGPLQAVANRVLPGAPSPAGATAPEPSSDTSSADPTTDSTADPTAEPGADPTTEPGMDPASDPASAEPGEEPALGAAAYGLCTAYRSGGLPRTSARYAELVAVAEGEAALDGYCSKVVAAKHPTKPTTKARKAKPAKPAKPAKSTQQAEPVEPETAATSSPSVRHTKPTRPAKPTTAATRQADSATSDSTSSRRSRVHSHGEGAKKTH